MNVIGSITGFSSSNVKSLLSNAKTGDVLQFDQNSSGGGIHSMIVYSVESDGVYIYDCNWDNNCGVSLAKRSFGYWSGRNSPKLTLLRSDNYPDTHTHNYTLHYELDHPHKYYKACSCGDWYYTGDNREISSCSLCINPGIPQITMNPIYVSGNISVTWNTTVNTTHYNTWLYKINDDGSKHLISNDFYVNSGITYSLTQGEYRVIVQSTNSKYYMDDGSTWRYAESSFDFSVRNNLTVYYKTNGGKILAKDNKDYDGYVCWSGGLKVSEPWLCGETLNGGLFNASSFGLVRDGYTFVGWSTAPDSNGVIFDQDDEKLLPETVNPNVLNENCVMDLYAAWEPNTYTFSYNSNGGTAEDTGNFNVTYGEYFEVNNTSCINEGYRFVGWTVKRNSDEKWYVSYEGWFSEDELNSTGYSKKIYGNGTVLPFDYSWIKGLSENSCSYTFFAVWENCDHVYSDWTITKSATCDQTGLQEKVCSICGNKVVQTIDATGHNYGNEWTIDKEASCIDEGVKSHHCKNCNNRTDITAIEKSAHTFGGWIISDEATCTGTGVKYRICSVCGFRENQGVSAEGHSWDSKYTIDRQATCTVDGLKSIHCTKCSATKDNTVIPAIGHSYTSKVTKAATCTEAGIRTYTCSKCNNSYTEVIPATGHIEVLDKAIAATCTTNGKTEGSHCSICNTIIKAQLTVPATGHSYTSKITKAATCAEVGVRTYTCSKCNDSYTEEIAKTGHTVVVDTLIPASCTTTGLTQGTHCSECGTVIIAQTTIPASGHTFGSWVASDAPTCTGSGYKYRICSVCGFRENQGVSTEGHSWDSKYTIDRQATCTEDGLKSIHCTKCSVTKDSVVIPATGHIEVKDNAVLPTCTMSGFTEGSHCSVCNTIINEQMAIPATGHKEVVDPAVEPTYNSTGLTEGKHCSVCGEVLVAQQVIDKLAAPMIAIRNNPNVATIDYGDGIKLTADVFNMPEGANIVWYVDGEKAAEGETFTLSKPDKTVTVTVKIVDKNGNVIVINGNEVSDTETVKVNNGFFKKLIAFFKNIFGMLKVHTQRIKYY